MLLTMSTSNERTNETSTCFQSLLSTMRSITAIKWNFRSPYPLNMRSIGGRDDQVIAHSASLVTWVSGTAANEIYVVVILIISVGKDARMEGWELPIYSSITRFLNDRNVDTQ